jgi:putative phage-type endonuclease
LTASRFGEICRATDNRDFNKLAQSIYSPPSLTCPAIVHGKSNEKVALQAFEKKMNIEVKKCGLFVNPNFPFLAASPDGYSEIDNKLVEIKCPYSGRNMLVAEGPEFPFLHISNDKLSLKRNHPYYYQVQGQMACSEKTACYFVVFTLNDMFVEIINYDPSFFEKEMLPKLKEFYFTYYEPLIMSCM